MDTPISTLAMIAAPGSQLQGSGFGVWQTSFSCFAKSHKVVLAKAQAKMVANTMLVTTPAWLVTGRW
jgi:hypothetical protein